jgi:hypothetical protein
MSDVRSPIADAAPQPAPFQNTPIVTLTDPTFVCTTCGTQYPPSPAPPTACPICDDERQYVPGTGQGWTTFAQLPQGRRNAFQRLEPQLLGIGTTPAPTDAGCCSPVTSSRSFLIVGT